MGYSIRFAEPGQSDDEVFDLATIGGLAALGEWVDTLPAADYPWLRVFIGAGLTEDTAALARDLARALASHPPGKPTVETTARNLAALIGMGSNRELAAIIGEAE
jgi:hypothetical protein